MNFTKIFQPHQSLGLWALYSPKLEVLTATALVFSFFVKYPFWNTLPTWTACLRYLGGVQPYLPFSNTLIKHSLHARLSSFPSLGFFRAIASATITSPISYGLLWGHFPKPRKIPAFGLSDLMAWTTADGSPWALSKNTRRELILPK